MNCFRRIFLAEGSLYEVLVNLEAFLFRWLCRHWVCIEHLADTVLSVIGESQRCRCSCRYPSIRVRGLLDAANGLDFYSAYVIPSEKFAGTWLHSRWRLVGENCDFSLLRSQAGTRERYRNPSSKNHKIELVHLQAEHESAISILLPIIATLHWCVGRLGHESGIVILLPIFATLHWCVCGLGHESGIVVPCEWHLHFISRCRRETEQLAGLNDSSE